MKRIVTQDDLDLNPDLVEQGVKVGDEIEFEPTTEERREPGEEPPAEGGPGSSQPPGSQPGKP